MSNYKQWIVILNTRGQKSEVIFFDQSPFWWPIMYWGDVKPYCAYSILMTLLVHCSFQTLATKQCHWSTSSSAPQFVLVSFSCTVQLSSMIFVISYFGFRFTTVWNSRLPSISTSTLNFSCSPSATASHYIICSESILCRHSYSLELSWCPHPFYVFDI